MTICKQAFETSKALAKIKAPLPANPINDATLAYFPAHELERAIGYAVNQPPGLDSSACESPALYAAIKRSASRARADSLTLLAHAHRYGMLADTEAVKRAARYSRLLFVEQGDENGPCLDIVPQDAAIPSLDLRVQVRNFLQALTYEFVTSRVRPAVRRAMQAA